MCTQPKKFVKPKVADVYGFLRRRNALIIHFSGPKGSEARPERRSQPRRPRFDAPQQRICIAKESDAVLAFKLHWRIESNLPMGNPADAADCAREATMDLFLRSRMARAIHLVRRQAGAPSLQRRSPD